MENDSENKRSSVGESERLRARAARLEQFSPEQSRLLSRDGELDHAWREWERTFDAIKDPVFLIGGDYRIVQANLAASRFLGKPIDEIVGQTCWKLVHGAESPPERCPWQKALETGKHEEAELYLEDKDVWIEVSVSPILDEHGKMTSVVHIMRDITQRKKAEASLRRSEREIHLIADSVPGLLAYVDRDERYRFVNSQYEQWFGLPPAQIVGKHCRDILGDQAYKAVEPYIQQALSGREVQFEEMVSYRVAGARWIHGHYVPDVIDAGGYVKGFFSLVTDVSDRKRAEQLLQREKEKAQEYLDVAAVMLIVIDSEQRVGLINKKGCEILGYTEDEIIGKNWFTNFLPASVRDEVRSVFESIVSGRLEPIECYENPVLTKSGKERLITWHNRVLRNEQGEVIGALSSGEDITERKKADDALREGEEKYRELFENAREAIITYDLNKKITGANRIVEEYGFKREHLLGRNYLDFVAEEHKVKEMESFQKLVSGTPVAGEVELVTPNGRVVAQFNDNPIIRHGRVIGVQSILTDITHLKKVEDGLRRLNRILETIADINQDLFRIKDRRLLLENICQRLVNYAYKLVWIGFCDRETKRVIPEAQAGFEEGYLEVVTITSNDTEHGAGPIGTAIRTGKPDVMRFIATDPRYEPWREEALKRGYRSSAAIPILADDKVIGALNVYADQEDAFSAEEIKLLEEMAHDISTGLRAIAEEARRKQAEEALRQSEEKFAKAFRASPNLMSITTLREGRIIDVNDAYCSLAGYGCKELIDRTVLGLNLWADPKQREAMAQQVREVGSVHDLQVEMRTKSGQTRLLLFSAEAITFGGEACIVNVATDITERRRAEDALCESEQKYRDLFENAREAIVTVDLEKRITNVNKLVEEYGFKREELIGKRLFDFVPEYDKARAVSDFETFIVGNMVQGEMDVITPRGIFTVEYKDNPIVREREVIGVQIILTDITERKKAEKQLLNYQTKLKALASELTLAEERLRQRIATDIHDHVSQPLVLSKMKLESLCESVRGTKVKGELRGVCDLLGQSISQMRAVTFDLSSPILHQLGLEQALCEYLTEHIESKHRIQTGFEDDGQPKPLSDDIQSLLFRDVRELLMNVVKHSHAKKVSLAVRRLGSEIHVTVEDDGVGFDPAEAAAASRCGGFGLFSIQEGLDRLGGRFHIDSSPGCGCKVTMTAPLKRKGTPK